MSKSQAFGRNTVKEGLIKNRPKEGGTAMFPVSKSPVVIVTSAITVSNEPLGDL